MYAVTGCNRTCLEIHGCISMSVITGRNFDMLRNTWMYFYVATSIVAQYKDLVY